MIASGQLGQRTCSQKDNSGLNINHLNSGLNINHLKPLAYFLYNNQLVYDCNLHLDEIQVLIW